MYRIAIFVTRLDVHSYIQNIPTPNQLFLYFQFATRISNIVSYRFLTALMMNRSERSNDSYQGTHTYTDGSSDCNSWARE